MEYVALPNIVHNELITRLEFLFRHDAMMRLTKDFAISSLESPDTILLCGKTVLMLNVKENYAHRCLIIDKVDETFKLILNHVDEQVQEMRSSLIMQWSDPIADSPANMRDASLTNKLYIFTQQLYIHRPTLINMCRVRGFHPQVFDDKRWASVWSEKIPDVFICHDSRDQITVTNDLYNDLLMRKIKAWYSEYAITIGDNIAARIDEGLTRCKYGIIVVTKNILENKSWAKSEMTTLLGRLGSSPNKKFILPVWYNVTKDEVAQSSAVLANIYAEIADKGTAVAAEQIAKVVLQSDSP